jgi:Protein of unknown function (DUF3768)
MVAGAARRQGSRALPRKHRNPDGLFPLTARKTPAPGEVFAARDANGRALAALTDTCPMDIEIDPIFARERIRQLNDETRHFLPDGVLCVTAGISALHADDKAAILARVRTFDDFTADNDRYGEHDFGGFDHNGETIFWKIDYYDQSLEGGSDEPWNVAKTRRVLTVMLASEY